METLWNQPVRQCNVTSCIRNLVFKAHAAAASFSIERTCHYAKDNICCVERISQPKESNGQYSQHV